MNSQSQLIMQIEHIPLIESLPSQSSLLQGKWLFWKLKLTSYLFDGNLNSIFKLIKFILASDYFPELSFSKYVYLAKVFLESADYYSIVVIRRCNKTISAWVVVLKFYHWCIRNFFFLALEKFRSSPTKDLWCNELEGIWALYRCILKVTTKKLDVTITARWQTTIISEKLRLWRSSCIHKIGSLLWWLQWNLTW